MKKIFRAIGGVLIMAAALAVLLLFLLAFPSPFAVRQEYGVSFSAPHAEGIGLDWKEAYGAILNDLQVKRLRLSAYWNTIERQEGIYDFSDLDYQMDLAQQHDAKVVLGVGRKLPRWPECHIPEWAEALPEEEQQKKVLELVERTAKRYKDHPALSLWQLENEPLLDFGHCPSEDIAFLREEERLLRTVGSSHPILITDSGELNSWIPASAYGDVLGTTMYRTVFSNRTQKLFHYDYIFPSWLYRLKARYIYVLRQKQVLISELQGEPWGVKPFPDMAKEERLASFSPQRFANLLQFAERTQLPVAYWWGVEYWYWEKEMQNDPSYWEFAKKMWYTGK